MNTTQHNLDNPVWNSLNETHQDFAIEYDGAKFYNPDYCPFGGFVTKENLSTSIDQYSTLINKFFVVGKTPVFSTKVSLKKDLVCHQMILETPINLETIVTITPLVTKQQKADLSELVNLVQPGYFRSQTAALGNYYGIYQNQQLIAVTGERMKMNDFTEISAVVTHPQHTRKGYATQLITYTTQQVFKENKMPYLHVAASNIHAIKLYEKLGFTTRRLISFWNFITV